jgi:hypothetical protein|tara:strand:+ start:1191 stop:2036 length:846 start_codon:yes stop_codon:yes gene_type:complete
VKSKYPKSIINTAKNLYIQGKSQKEVCKELTIPEGSIWRILKDIKQQERKKLPKGFRPKHTIPKTSTFMSKEKARILGYLAAEGHVRMDEGYNKKKRAFYKSNGVIGYKQARYKHALISFCSTEPELIKKYIKDFYKVYKIKTKYIKKKCEVSIRSIEVYKDLIKYCKFGSKEWEIPKEVLNRNIFGKEWLKAFYDGEAHIDNHAYQKRIVINSINQKGLISIKDNILKKIGVTSKLYGPYHWKNFKSFRLIISRKDNLIKFNEEIGFYHPKKQDKLQKLL